MKCYHTDELSGALGCSAINAAFVKGEKRKIMYTIWQLFMIKAAVCYKFKLNAIHNIISSAAVEGKDIEPRPLSFSFSFNKQNIHWLPHVLLLIILLLANVWPK